VTSDAATVARSTSARPLTGIRVLEVADVLAAYAGRLLADLGAEVVRLEPADGAGSVRLGPHHAEPGRPPVSLFERFVNAGKRSMTLDLAAPEAGEVLDRLLGVVDVLLVSPEQVLAAHGVSDAHLDANHPDLVRVVVTPFGRESATPGDEVDDLLLLAKGGLLHLGGYPDAGPVVPFGAQSTFMASIYAAVAAVTGLLSRQRDGAGVSVDVSAQECVAQALEDSVVGYALTGDLRQSQGDSAKEAGTGIYRCADGYVSVVAGRLGTAPAWAALVDWLVETDTPGSAALRDEQWTRFAYRQQPEAVASFQVVFERFAATRTRQALYLEAQRRKIALSPVNDLAAVLDNEQLRHRDFFVTLDDPEAGRPLTFPKAPYRFGGTPLDPPTVAPRRGADTTAVLAEVGLGPAELHGLVERGVV